MKITIFALCTALGLALVAFSQTPTPFAPPDVAATSTPFASPTASIIAAPSIPTITPTPTATLTPPSTITPTASSSTPSLDQDIESAIEKKIRKHFTVNFDDDHFGHDSEIPKAVIPIVLIGCLAVFGTPVMIVAVIMYFSFSKSRALHKTVQMMVEKGQPVPEALLNPPPVVRQRSDLRRGIKWLLVGVGLMIFLGACSDWDGGAWSLGIIPFMIGVGYLIFWKLDIRQEPPSPPV